MTDLFSRMIVGIDGSEPSRVALELACRLAQEHGGELVLCHAVPGRDRVKGEALLGSAEKEANRRGAIATARLADGDPAAALLEAAADTDSTLIVMGTHGRSGFERLIVGSTTEGVLRSSTLPVLTIASGVRLAASSRRCFERIVVGLDGSEAAEAAVCAALGFPAEDRRDLIFYSIVEDDAEYEHALEIVQQAVTLAQAQGVAAKGHVSIGKPHDALIDAGKGIVHEGRGTAHVPSRLVESQADLMILGSRGNNATKGHALGSLVESLVRSGALPVLVVYANKETPLRVV